MQLPDPLRNRILHNSLLNFLFNRLGVSDPADSEALVQQAELVRLQQLANDHTWSPLALREVAHRMSGDVRSVYLGAGMDYEESRPYQSGDDLRFMNWRLSARTGQHYMKVFREEKRPATFILIDKRASMRFGSRKRLKISQAIRLSAYAAFSAIHRHCAVAGVVLNEQLDWFDACYDDGGVYHFLNKAAEACIPAYNMSSDGASLDSTIKLLQKMMVAGSDVCLVSDFHDLGEASRAALLQLSLECNVTAIQVYDPAEEELPSSGSLFMNENSNTEAAFVNTEDELVRQAFHEEMISRYEKVKQFFAGIGINHVRVSTNCEDIDRVMLGG